MKEKAEKSNKADLQIFQTEKQLKEFGSTIPIEKKNAIEEALDELKLVHQDQNFKDIDEVMLTLGEVCRAVEVKSDNVE